MSEGCGGFVALVVENLGSARVPAGSAWVRLEGSDGADVFDLATITIPVALDPGARVQVEHTLDADPGVGISATVDARAGRAIHDCRPSDDVSTLVCGL